ncbi:ankyrin [Mytilinidion resinicola]|uniref:Ankyrin n=1 Tax=Mytilinidion resinicola TaxID=574789 RepID=A0A6A6YJP8_9PEZI|nr:ankyrin [Mytilinidion resinicola]KAF2808147.1 ankyrin [Mytilinidion resinicola]
MFHPLNCALAFPPIRYAMKWTKIERRMIAELLIEKGADSNVPFPDGDYPIHKVVEDFREEYRTDVPDAGHDQDFKKMSREHFTLLMSRCSNIDIQNSEGNTALHIVLQHRYYSWSNLGGLGYAQMLLEAGADPFLPDHSGKTPYEHSLDVSTSSTSSDWTALKFRTDDFYTLLHFFTSCALKSNRVQLIPAKLVYEQAYAEHCLKLLFKYLLRHNASGKLENGTWPAIDWMNEFPDDWDTEFVIPFLQYAQQLGKNNNVIGSRIMKLLETFLGRFSVRIDGLLDNSTRRDQPIWAADEKVGRLELEAVELIPRLGADPMGLSASSVYWPRRNITFPSPVPHTFRAQSPKILKLFIEHGVDLTWSFAAGNILHQAVENDNVPMNKILLEAGVDVDISGTSDGFTPLNRALVLTHLPHMYQGPNKLERRMIATLLIQHGADVNIPSPDGDYPIHSVVKHFHDRSFQYLGSSSVSRVVEFFYHYGDSDKMGRKYFRMLMSRCSNINVQNREGKTALHVALQRKAPFPYRPNDLGYAEMLLVKGADPFLPDSFGKTPYQYALNASNWGADESVGMLALNCPFNQLYDQIHFLTAMALKIDRVQPIPARLVYEQAFAEHCLKPLPRKIFPPFPAYAGQPPPRELHIDPRIVKVFLDVMHALEQFPPKVGPIGLKKLDRSFWNQYSEGIINPTFKADVHMLEWREECQGWPDWTPEEWQKWRDSRCWMKEAEG